MTSEAAELRELLDFGADVDDLVEHALRDRCTLVRAMERILPEVAARIGAKAAFLRSFGEDLALHTYAFPADLRHEGVDAFLRENEADHDVGGARRAGDDLVVAQSLDVAGEWFGSAGVVLDAAREGEAPHLEAMLRVFCEEIDNFLHTIRAARQKQNVMSALARALRNRVLGEGLADAVSELDRAVSMDRLLLAVLAWDAEDAPVHVQVYEGGKKVVDTMSGARREDAAAIDEEARAYLFRRDRRLLARFGLERSREEVLIHGVKDTTLVGKIVVLAKGGGDFDMHDRDLLAGFADFICQRVVDFSKEYKMLARSFRPDDVNRMLATSDYVERYLVPRERTVAMLYVDISGFTRTCEQILVDPKRIGRLVDVWGGAAVDLLWEHGGVFDKMVGDCVIGLFGPPFFEDDPAECLARAIRAAVAIRAMTNALPEREGFDALRAEGLGVSTGVNLAPLFVGRFGPDENYTGFSAGMNNTARLQSLASRNEILVMDDAVKRLSGAPFSFGEVRTAKVKNVAQPLAFRALV